MKNLFSKWYCHNRDPRTIILTSILYTILVCKICTFLSTEIIMSANKCIKLENIFQGLVTVLWGSVYNKIFVQLFTTLSYIFYPIYLVVNYLIAIPMKLSIWTLSSVLPTKHNNLFHQIFLGLNPSTLNVMCRYNSKHKTTD